MKPQRLTLAVLVICVGVKVQTSFPIPELITSLLAHIRVESLQGNILKNSKMSMGREKIYPG